MLQRAASNAYSWWWASHIRTKQSKWLEQNLQDMEDKVQYVLKLIEEDGDSFAKRAEMYYKKRPELIHFVEESYRAYRALAERYDHISTELQNANNTIAYVFPEQVQFAMEEDDETPSPKFPKKTSEGSTANVPKVPKIPKDFKGMFASATKKFQPKKSKNVTPTATGAKSGKSGLSKDKGLQEIDSIQKQILGLQTEKEFVKSSYESGLAKYWEIEQQIEEMQDKVSSLQDEFGSGIVIEDDEARTLMALAALKSCQDSLAQLQEKQETSTKEAAIEQKRVKNVQEKLKSLKIEFSNGQVDEEKPHAKREPTSAAPEKILAVQENTSPQKSQDLELLRKKLKEHFEVEFNTSHTVTELAERIDQLVNKVISLETAVSSQTALIMRLRTETDDLQGQMRTLEDDKATLISGKTDLSEKVRSMEEKLHGIQDLDQNVEDQKKNLQTHFTEAHLNLDHLSERLHSVKPDEELQEITETKEGQMVEAKPQGFKEVEGPPNHIGSLRKTQNVKQGEETEASSKMQVEFKEEICALNSDGVEESKDVMQTEELEVAGKMHKDFNEKEVSLNPDHLQEPQYVKADEESHISDSSQKEKELSTEVSLMLESKEQEEKSGHLDSSEQVADNKKEGVMNELHAVDDALSEKYKAQKMEEEVNKQALAKTVNEQATKQDDEPDWKHLFMNGMENREQVLLKEYTTVLRNYKEVKKRLNDSENKPEKKTGGDGLFDAMVQLRELKISNAKKDEQIRILRQKLNLMNVGFGDQNEADKSMVSESPKVERDVTDDLKHLLEEQDAVSKIEQKFRTNIDELLEENLEFWLRFSSTFHEIQKFGTEIKDLQSELSKLEDKQNKQEGSSTAKYSLKSDAKPLYKHLREIHTELSVWLETSMLLKDELKSRFSSLCNIQKEITGALKESAEDEEFAFTSYQAAKFQGEILNMKQENNKVADELQAGLDHVTTLQLEVEKTLAKLNEEFKLSGSKNSLGSQLPRSDSRSRVPLRSFIFGIKPKRQKHSIFSCMHPAFHRKYNGFKSSSNT